MNCDPNPDDFREAAEEIHPEDADRGSSSAPHTRLEFLDYGKMSRLPEEQWLIEGLLPARKAALMFGASNSFKSFAAIDIACCVATGTSWHGHATAPPGKVVYVATEGANGVGRRRIPAWCDNHDIPQPLRQNIYLYPDAIAIDEPLQVANLIETIKALGPFVLVVLDIFGATMSGSEIEDKTARAWVIGIQRIIRETGATVLAVAHTGWQDKTRARMHTHFWGSFDTRLKVVGDAKALTSVLTVDRHKEADSVGTWNFEMCATGGSLVPVLTDMEVGPRSSLKGAKKVAMDALDEALAQSGERKSGENWPTCRLVSIDAWRKECNRRHLSASDNPDSERKAFQRAQDELRDRGLIHLRAGYVWKSDNRTKRDMSGNVRRSHEDEGGTDTDTPL